MKKQVLLITAIALVLMLGAGGYILNVRSQQNKDLAARNQEASERVASFESSKTAPRSTLASPPEELSFGADVDFEQGDVLVVNRVPGDDYGKLALRNDDGSRELFDKTCTRVHLAAHTGFCLGERGISAYVAEFFDLTKPDLPKRDEWNTILPSRAQVSPGGLWTASTVFASGTSYQDVGNFSTFVEFASVENVNRRWGARNFKVESDDPKYVDPEGNFWGVTFIDDDQFYITHGLGTDIDILKGTISTRTLEPTGWLGSCPSLSPDGSTLVVKEMDGENFQLVTIDVATGERTPLGETRSVDDQINWMSDDTILYALHTNEKPEEIQPEFDIWSLNITDGSEPELFLPNADSPATYFP